MIDAELVALAREGDEEAIEALVSRYLPAVYRLSMRLGLDASMAEDIAQESFVKAWRSLKKFDETKTFLPWMLSITRNTALDMLRKRRSVPFSALSPEEGEDGMAFADTLTDGEPLPDEVFERAETGATVAAALKELPERDRTVLTLRYEEELSFEDIASAMKAPMNTVKSWHRRAQAKLREILIRSDAPRHD